MSVKAFPDYGTLPVSAANDDVVQRKAGVWTNRTIAQLKTDLALTTVATDTVWDTKGDLAVGTGADTAAKLITGTDFVDALIPDASQTTGLRWGKVRSALMPSGAIAETFDRAMIAGAAAPATGQERCFSIDLPKGVTITSITFITGSQALVAGSSPHFWVALRNSSLALLRQSNDNTSLAWAATTPLTTNLSQSFLTTYSGLHYISLMVVSGSGGTQPTIATTTGAASANTVAPIRAGQTGSNLTTTAPDPATALSAVGGVAWAYVS